MSPLSVRAQIVRADSVAGRIWPSQPPPIEGRAPDAAEQARVAHADHPRGSPRARSASSVRRISDVPDEIVTDRE